MLCAQLNFAQNKIDSLEQGRVQFPQLPDSLKAPWTKVDSIRNDFNTSSDSLTNAYQQSLAPLNKRMSKVLNGIDSLNNLQIPPTELNLELDSLKQQRVAVENQFNSKSSQLKTKTIGKLDRVEMTPEMQGPVGDFKQKVDGFNISNNDFVKIPALEVKGYALPDIKSLPNIPSIGAEGKLGNLPGIETKLGDVTQLTGKVQGLGSDVKNLRQGNLNDVDQLPRTLEEQAGKIDGISELQEASGFTDDYGQKISSLKNPDAIKEQAKEMVQEKAIDHFAGKDKELKSAMSEISKIKLKYSSVSSIKDLPKRPPNAMKGKPFIERVVPGLYLQFQQKNAYLFDVNPYFGYRISGKFTSGIGWNHRFGYDKAKKDWVPEKRIFGPRAYFDFNLGKGFIGHIETELMNTFVPLNLIHNPDNGKREWVSSTMLGVKKQYRIYRNLNGTMLIQYNLYNRYFKAPYLDRLNSRMGLEYTLKKRKKIKSEESVEKE
jgi:hypothetical protein